MKIDANNNVIEENIRRRKSEIFKIGALRIYFNFFFVFKVTILIHIQTKYLCILKSYSKMDLKLYSNIFHKSKIIQSTMVELWFRSGFGAV